MMTAFNSMDEKFKFIFKKIKDFHFNALQRWITKIPNIAIRTGPKVLSAPGKTNFGTPHRLFAI